MLALGGLTADTASADAIAPDVYRQAVQDAYDLVKVPTPNEVARLQAITALESGTGSSQPEILRDLRRQPPDYVDARARMLALLAALDQPANTSDPQQAQQRLHDVLAMSRYDALRSPPSFLDRFGQWARDLIRRLLRQLFGGSGAGPQVASWFLYLIGIAVLAAVAIVIFRSARGRFVEDAMANQPAGPRAPADYFAEADRLAAEGDRVGAIRALCAGVAATLAGEHTWVGSPLTVREIFQRAPDPTRLRPLLVPFEAAVYGGREVDAATYERAAQVTAPYREPATVAA
ncbi:MAG TPA: hypothetical protein VGU71_15245 [Candidatus Dormibacteraeota bacterium]|nr:hypothetical protein [Candidatus Dormibacteraeota bacterium]